MSVEACRYCGKPVVVTATDLLVRCAGCGLMHSTQRLSEATKNRPITAAARTAAPPPQAETRSTMLRSTYADHLPANLTAPQAVYAALFGLETDTANNRSARSAIKLAATTIASDDTLEASRVGFHAALLNAMAANPDPAESLALEYSSNGAAEEVVFGGDPPGFEEWKGERKLAGMDAYSLPQLVNRDWSNGLRIKANDWKDDRLGLLPAQVKGLGRKARQHRSDLLVQLLIDGFTALSYDGAAFFATTHETGSNKLTSALDAAGLVAAELLLSSQTTLDGSDVANFMGTHLIVGPKLRATAEKLLTQEYLASGESNSQRGSYKLIVTPRLRGTADDYWFLADLSQGFKPLRLQMREEISTSAQIAPESEGAFSRNEYRYGAQARYAVGYFDHRLIVGSQVA